MALLLPVPVPVPVAEAEAEAVLQPLPLPLGEMLGLAPLLRLLVGVEDWEALRLGVLLGVPQELGVPLRVCVPLLVAELVAEGVVLPLGESEDVAEGLAPWDRLGVGLLLIELLKEDEEVGVTVPVPLTV